MALRMRASEFKKLAKAMGMPMAPPMKSAAPPIPNGVSKAVVLAMFAAHGLPRPEIEYRFAVRKWRFDFCWVEHKLALEVEGGVWTEGRHTSGAGFMKDMEKYNAAVILGFRILRCTPEQLESGEACALVKMSMEKGGEQTKI